MLLIVKNGQQGELVLKNCKKIKVKVTVRQADSKKPIRVRVKAQHDAVR